MPFGQSPVDWMNAPSSRVSSITPIATPAPAAGGGALGGGGGLDPALLQKLLASLTASSAEAKGAATAQYGDLLSSVGNTKTSVLGAYDQAGSLLAGQGNTAKQDINDTLDRQNASSEQDLVSRGLGNTTIRSSVLRGNETAATRARNGVDENIAAQNANLQVQKAGALGNLGNLEADSILSKNVQGPDMNQYLSLLSQLGQTGASAGGASSGRGRVVSGPASTTSVVRSAGLGGAGR